MARRWTDEELQDLIRLPKKQFAEKYGISEGYVSTLKYRKKHILEGLQPDEIINLGDTIDLAELSRFDPESDHFYRTLAPSFQRVHDYYAELRADNPNAKITEVDSNHNARLGKFVLKYAQQFWGLQRANESESTYPVMSYPYLANLEHVGVDFVSGYESEYIYGSEYDTPPIVFKHGKMVRSNGSTASAEAKANPETHLVRGHGHRLEMHTRTNRQGDYLTYLQIGALCRITGEVPSYHSSVDVHGNVNHKQEDWQQTVLVVRDHNGQYEFDNIFIKDGKAFYQGREFYTD